MAGFGNQYLIFCMAMEEVVCTIQPMKLVTMDHETVSGCGVVDILFPSVAGTKVYGFYVLEISGNWLPPEFSVKSCCNKKNIQTFCSVWKNIKANERTESTLCSCLNVEEFLIRNRRGIWSLSECSGIWVT